MHILHDGLAAISGGAPAPFIDPRMGLERTFGPFDHPILYGVFSAAAFSLAWHVVAEKRLTNLPGMAQVWAWGSRPSCRPRAGPTLS